MQDFMHANTGYAMEQCTEQPLEQPLQQAMEEMNGLGYNDTSTITTTTSSPKNGLAMEQNLQHQLSQLQTNFTNDYHFYSKQIRLAHNLIKQQESQLNRLEAISAYRQSHMIHQPGIHHDNQRCKEQPIPPSDSGITGKKQAVPENRAFPLDCISTANQK
jgi:ribosomal protein S13